MAKTERPKGSKMRQIDTAFDPVAAALKQLHQAVADEDVPDVFLRILEEIDTKIANAKSMQ